MSRTKTIHHAADVVFRTNVTKARMAFGWSATRLSREAGIMSTAVWQAENRGRLYSLGEAVQIASVLSQPLERLLDESSEFVVQIDAP